MARITIVLAILLALLVGCSSSPLKQGADSASANTNAAKVCKEIDSSYPCCCVIGNYGECMSDADCKEILGECVPKTEHWRCTAGTSAMKARGRYDSFEVEDKNFSTQPLNNNCVTISGHPNQTASVLENTCDQYVKVAVRWRSPSQGGGVSDQVATYHLNPKWERPMYQRAQLPTIDSVSSFEDTGNTDAAKNVKFETERLGDDSEVLWLTNLSMSFIAVTYGLEYRYPSGSKIAKKKFVLRPGERTPVTYISPSWMSFVGFLFAVFDPD